MRKILSFQTAAKASLVLYTLFLLFHLSIILGVVLFDFAPVEFLWGGQMHNAAQLLNFELVSFFTLAFCFFLTSVRAKYVHIPRLSGVAKMAMWVLFFLFILNTLGNIVAKTWFEKSLALVTGALALLSLRLALEKSA